MRTARKNIVRLPVKPDLFIKEKGTLYMDSVLTSSLEHELYQNEDWMIYGLNFG